jgi:hypothetical protein
MALLASGRSGTPPAMSKTLGPSKAVMYSNRHQSRLEPTW